MNSKFQNPIKNLQPYPSSLTITIHCISSNIHPILLYDSQFLTITISLCKFFYDVQHFFLCDWTTERETNFLVIKILWHKIMRLFEKFLAIKKNLFSFYLLEPWQASPLYVYFGYCRERKLVNNDLVRIEIQWLY